MFIFPVNKDGFRGRVPIVLVVLLLLNTVALAATYLLYQPETVFRQLGFLPSQPTFLTALSSMFIHAGILHLLGNAWFLWMFGYRLENTTGKVLFAFVYFTSGLGAAWTHYWFESPSILPMVGASGAVSGIAGIYWVLFPHARFELDVYFLHARLKTIPTQAHGAIGAWIGIQILLALLSESVQFKGIAFWAHVGGFGSGILLGIMLRLGKRFGLRDEKERNGGEEGIQTLGLSERPAPLKSKRARARS